MTLFLWASEYPDIGRIESRRIERTLEAASSFDDPVFCLPDGLSSSSAPISVTRFPRGGDRLERSVRIRTLVRDARLIHCLDFESAAELALSGIAKPIVLGSCLYPSIQYQDQNEEVCHETLSTLIEREEQVLKRVRHVFVPNLHAQQYLLSRGVSAGALSLVPDILMPPLDHVSAQSLAHFVYVHERKVDARVIYDALLRLQFPWRLTVIESKSDGMEIWRRDARVTVLSPQQNWRSKLASALVAICGGSRSRAAEDGLDCSPLAVAASASGVSVLGTENKVWRSMIGGMGLLPPDRPDLIAVKLATLVESESARVLQHSEIYQRWANRPRNEDLLVLRERWNELIL